MAFTVLRIVNSFSAYLIESYMKFIEQDLSTSCLMNNENALLLATLLYIISLLLSKPSVCCVLLLAFTMYTNLKRLNICNIKASNNRQGKGWAFAAEVIQVKLCA